MITTSTISYSSYAGQSVTAGSATSEAFLRTVVAKVQEEATNGEFMREEDSLVSMLGDI